MPISDVQLVFQWWSALFLVGVAAFPLTKKLFSPWPASPETSSRGWFDHGYFFSKAVGFAVVSYIIYLLGTLRIAPFTVLTVIGAIGAVFVGGIILQKTQKRNHSEHSENSENQKVRLSEIRTVRHSERLRFRLSGFPSFPSILNISVIVFIEELFFFGALLFWSWVKAHEPSIQGLEKFMDYGFMQSILNSQYFPAPDMWWAGGNINYYYFGHLVTAVLTRLSGLDLSVTFNLMLATLFALTLTMSFSIGVQLMEIIRKTQKNSEDSENQPVRKSASQKISQSENKRIRFSECLTLRLSDSPSFQSFPKITSFLNGLLTAFLVTFAGNMQTLYAFTKGYTGDNVVPFWTILWSPFEFFSKVGEGMNRYWYANATRFIPFTIHEFPSYSFVVSDVHGHVLSIPFVLLAIALLITIIWTKNNKQKTSSLLSAYCSLSHSIFYGFLLGILLMTNALDGPIYGLLFASLIVASCKLQVTSYDFWKKCIIPVSIVGFITLLTALPFLVHFKSFATGIGVNCPPEFLANTKIGPFLFEGVEKCQKSPLWMMWILWGFFWFTGAWLFVKRIWGKGEYDAPVQRILKVVFIFCLFLIIIPEFLYVKDIYPAHFRSNTMFKLGYEAFILWSIISAYVIVHFLSMKRLRKIRTLFFLLLIPQLFLVSIFPIFSVRSYFGELRTYQGIRGTTWLEKEYPDDWKAIEWLKEKTRDNEHVTCKKEYSQGSPSFAHCLMSPVIVEADGDSYTDYNHISAFAGVPTIVGWGVHEWLWRGGYDEVAPRREEVKKIYTSTDKNEIRTILTKYAVRYIIIGKLEREKYPDLVEGYIASMGTVAFQSGTTTVYEVKEE